MKHILTGKALIITFIIVALFVTGCILWSQREIRIANEKWASTEESTQKMEERKSKPVEHSPDQTGAEDPETTEAEPIVDKGTIEIPLWSNMR